ncbi:ABC transporter ATP-binding protein [Sphaerisporangium aureirubrum]|uniref:ABC transporter ATP-binding protein n=1 Tax=Sphaerisporangium aureirubrum TaxID=1544736 RepID=A0ABW1ND21_9ACTN
MRTPNDQPAVEVDALRQSYGDFEAVRGISFTVRRGELFALLGTNGAGKTTTMEVLEGMRPARHGHVRVLGLDPHRQRRRLRPSVGIMLQEGGFVGDLTVAETVRVWGGLSADVGRPPAGAVLETVGLERKARTRVRQLSGGQKRRLDLALAVLSGPEVLFLDEPTTGMDPEARRDTWDVIGNLRAQGTTVLLTTHYLEEAERLADHLAIMHEGTVHAHGTVEEVVAKAGDRIVFRLPRLPRGGVPSLLDTPPEVTRAGDGAAVTYTIDGASPADRAHTALRSLLSWADEHELTLQRLEVRKGTLEDVFLSVVGDAR